MILNTTKTKPGHPMQRQRGAALFVALMFLIILTGIGLSAANVGVLQERMAGNVRETNEAFQEAEATLRIIEQALSNCIVGGAGCTLGGVPIWSELQNDLLPGLPKSACTLESDDISVNTWEDLWKEAPFSDGQYFAVAISAAGAGGTVIGSSCVPLNGETGLPIDEVFIVAARATGPQGVGDVVVQSIFYWPI